MKLHESYLQEFYRRYEQWWTENALTEAIATRQVTFSFEQMVQMEEKDSEGKLKGITLSCFTSKLHISTSRLLVATESVWKFE